VAAAAAELDMVHELRRSCRPSPVIWLIEAMLGTQAPRRADSGTRAARWPAVAAAGLRDAIIRTPSTGRAAAARLMLRALRWPR
jgi:hypothetical protein